MNNLVDAYMHGEIDRFEKILRENRSSIMDDPFIRHYMEDLLKNIRTQVLVKLVAPYTRVRIAFIATVRKREGEGKRERGEKKGRREKKEKEGEGKWSRNFHSFAVVVCVIVCVVCCVLCVVCCVCFQTES
jgi:hypothetical protein